MYFSPKSSPSPSVSSETGWGLISILCLGWQFATPQTKLWSLLTLFLLQILCFNLKTGPVWQVKLFLETAKFQLFRKQCERSPCLWKMEIIVIYQTNINPTKFRVVNPKRFLTQNSIKAHATRMFAPFALDSKFNPKIRIEQQNF